MTETWKQCKVGFPNRFLDPMRSLEGGLTEASPSFVSAELQKRTANRVPARH